MRADKENLHSQASFHINLDSKGRLLLPAELRKKAGFKEGDLLNVKLDSNHVAHISSMQGKIRSLRGLWKPGRKSKGIVDQFLKIEGKKLAMSKYVLDASALIAYLVDEEGSIKVENYLRAGACISTANWAEVLSKGQDLGKSLKELDILVKGHGSGEGIRFFPLTVEDAQVIGELRSTTKKLGLSLGDRACLALAYRLKLPAVTADRSWLKLQQAIEVISVR